MSSVRIIAGTCAVALLGAASAQPTPPPQPERPAVVVVRRDGGFAPRPRVYWYGRDAIAYLHGVLDDVRHGSFRARVDYAQVERIVADEALCTTGTTKRPSPVTPPPTAMDAIVYSISVRCGSVWHEFRTTEIPRNDADAVRILNALRRLDALVAALAWKHTDDDLTPPDGAGLH